MKATDLKEKGKKWGSACGYVGGGGVGNCGGGSGDFVVESLNVIEA